MVNKEEQSCKKKKSRKKGRNHRGKTPVLQDHPTWAEDNKGTYFGSDPICDVGLHCTDMLLGIINRDKEISGLTINVIIKLKSVEKRR